MTRLQWPLRIVGLACLLGIGCLGDVARGQKGSARAVPFFSSQVQKVTTSAMLDTANQSRAIQAVGPVVGVSQGPTPESMDGKRVFKEHEVPLNQQPGLRAQDEDTRVIPENQLPGLRLFGVRATGFRDFDKFRAYRAFGTPGKGAAPAEKATPAPGAADQ